MPDYVRETQVVRVRVYTISALIGSLLLMLVALNAPITFASGASAPAHVSSVAQEQNTTQVTGDAADVAADASPATVTVLNLQVQRDPFSSRDSGELTPVGSGSGYIIDEAGHVVTNNHVVEGGVAFQVLLVDGTEIDAELVGSDSYQDVAVLQLDLADGQTVPATLSFGDSDDVRQGDEVIAIGTPYGEYTNSVTVGEVNGVNRDLDTGIGYHLPNLIQHDAAIYPGNSGGPLIDMNGDVIGMNVAKATDPTGANADTQISFAIASDAVEPIVDEIIANGEFARPYLGVRSQVTFDGQQIISVEPNGPAADAGLRAGDVITAMNGNEIDRDNQFVDQLIFGHQPGDTVTLSVTRGSDTMEIDVKLAERPADLQ